MTGSDSETEDSEASYHNFVLGPPADLALPGKVKWGRPEFTPVDGIGRQEGLDFGGGMVLAIGYVDSDEGLKVCGSGVMVAPGLILTATHVAEEARGRGGLAIAFYEQSETAAWALSDVHFFGGRMESIPGIVDRPFVSDVAIVSCAPFSPNALQNGLSLASVEVTVPKVGERLWGLGFRQESRNENTPSLGMYCTSGTVTGHMLEGRGRHLNGPCIEVAMNALGGMSGGPVFNETGNVVGLISTSFDAEDSRGPTYVSTAAPLVESRCR